jgi:hypothetical protein
MSRSVIVTILSFFICVSYIKAQSEANRADSVLYYKTGKDSMRVIFKGSKIHKQIFYFSDGKKRSETTWIKDKWCKIGNYQHKKLKFLTWDHEGKIVKRSRGNIKLRGIGEKQVYWIFLEDGKSCLKREKDGWSSKL